jgi:uncharacterized membrane protein (UPF0127 family)
MIFIAFFAMKHQSPSVCVSNKGVAAVGSLRYAVTLAVNPAEWERGLSGRPSLATDEGMLFLFPSSSVRAFWMKDMNFPIDIIWIDKGWRVVGVETHATPDTYPRTFTSPSSVSRVLEIASAGELGSPIRIGDQIQFNCL